jgi:hypothetical protein
LKHIRSIYKFHNKYQIVQIKLWQVSYQGWTYIPMDLQKQG